MKYFTSKVVDPAVADKIDHLLLDKVFAEVKLPEFLQAFSEIVVLLAAREPNDYPFDAWPDEEKFFMTIPLDYREVLQSGKEEVTKLCRQKYEEYLGQLNEHILDQKDVYGFPTILQFLVERNVDYLEDDVEVIIEAIRFFRNIVGDEEYYADQTQLFLSILESERNKEDALQVSKKALELLADPDVF